MNPQNRKSISYVVRDFLEDSDAIIAMKENRAIPWRIQWLAEEAFKDSVRDRKECGFLPFMHDGSTLKKGT